MLVTNIILKLILTNKSIYSLTLQTMISDQLCSNLIVDTIVNIYYPGDRKLILNVDYIKEQLLIPYRDYLSSMIIKIESRSMRRSERSDEESSDDDTEELGESPKTTFVKSIIKIFSFDKISSRWSLNDDDWDLLFGSITQIVNDALYSTDKK